MLKMKIDSKTLRILSEIARDKPNSLRIARKTGLPQPTVYRRLQKLASHKCIHAVPDLFKLNLRPLLFIGKLNIENSQLFFVKLSARIVRSNPENTFVFFTIPADYFYDYVSELKKYAPSSFIAQTYNYIEWIPDVDFVTFKQNRLKVKWCDLCNHVLSKDVRDKYLVASQSMRIDEYDLKILKALEEDASVQLKEIASKNGMYLELVMYHYRKHVKPIIRYNSIKISLCSDENPMWLMKIDAKNRYNIEKLMLFLEKIPWLNYAFPLRDEYSVIVTITFPYYEVLDFHKALEVLRDNGIIENWTHIGLIDKCTLKENPTPYEYFHAGKWINVVEKLKIIVPQ